MIIIRIYRKNTIRFYHSEKTEPGAINEVKMIIENYGTQIDKIEVLKNDQIIFSHKKG